MTKESDKDPGDPSQAEAIQSEERRAQLLGAADELRKEMERLSLTARDLILAQPPVQLLGYLLAQLQMSVIAVVAEAGDDARPDKEAIKSFQLAAEYAHAVWSCHSNLAAESVPLDEAKAAELFQVLDELATKTMIYCMASSAANLHGIGNRQSADTEFKAKSSWALIRGHRYQVLEGEFFRFVLEPHADALREAYGMEFDAIAGGIQDIADALRTGFSDAVEKMTERMDQTYRIVEESGEELGAVIARLKDEDPDFESDMSGVMRDMFFGGVCNLSRHTNLSPTLLEDLSYTPGGNTDFYAEGEFIGTPMRTLPARIKPGIKLGDEFYATDGQFVRDSAYRAIQWGLWARLPLYRDEWIKRQGRVVEQAYPTIFSNQLDNALTYSSVFYKDINSGQWVETDLLIVLDDALLIIEAKAGAMPMHSPATNFASHERIIQELIVKAYRQCKRFLDYLASKPEVALYHLIGGAYVETARIRRANYRLIIPIGLTVEAFTPFSAMAKELAEVQPILGVHPFISMSVDDLFVLNRFLSTTGELLHYLEVRQQVAGIPNAMLFDEIDHLGAYISRNRFDMDLRAQLEEADKVTWNSFSDVVDKHFEGPSWETDKVPSQSYPDHLSRILSSLDELRPTGWLRMDAFLRNYGGDGRENFARFLSDLEPTLAQHPRRRFQIGEDNPLQMWICRNGAAPNPEEIRFQAEAGCLTVGAAEMLVLIALYNRPGDIGGLRCFSFPAPTILQNNYGELLAEANRQRGRMLKLDRPRKPAKRRRR